MKGIRVGIVDDHQIFRDGLSSILINEGMTITGEASNGDAFINILKNKLVDLAFIDINMPGMDGIETTKYILQDYPNIKIIALTMHWQENYILEMINAGATGYLFKSSDKKEIIEAINTVLNNEMYFSKEIDKIIIKNINDRYSKRGRTKNIADLSDTEIQIIKLICEEYSSEEIAKLLFLSKRTIDGARQRIQFKLNVSSTAGLVKFAIVNGLYKIP